jgi:hypothetical protein
MEFRQNLENERDLTVIQSAIELFVEKSRPIIEADFDDLLFVLFYKFRVLEYVGLKVSLLAETNQDFVQIKRYLLRLVSTFHSVSGIKVDCEPVRLLMPIANKLRETVDDEFVDEIQDVATDLEAMDMMLTVTREISRILSEEFPDSTVAPIVPDSRFFDFPELKIAFENKEIEANGRFSMSIEFFKSLIQKKSTSIEMVSSFLEQIRGFSERKVIEDVLIGPPCATEASAFAAWMAVCRSNFMIQEPNYDIENALESLHLVHFYFAALDLGGLASYSDSILSIYLRGHSEFLFGQAVAVEELRAKWEERSQTIDGHEINILLGEIRGSFEDLVNFVNDLPVETISEKEPQLLELFDLFTNSVFEDLSIEATDRVIQLMTEFSSEKLDPIVSVLKEYSLKKRLSSDIEPIFQFFDSFFNEDFRMTTHNSKAACLPIFIQSANHCFETGEVRFDRSALNDGRFDDLHLFVSYQVKFQMVSIEIEELNDPALSSAIQLIFRGSFSPISMVKCFRAAIRTRVWLSIVNLAWFLFFVQSRDEIFGDFSMLRQINLRSLESLGNGYRFLSTVLPLPSPFIHMISNASQQLKRLVNKIPLTDELDSEHFDKLFLEFSRIQVAADHLDFSLEYSKISALLYETQLFEPFQKDILPILENFHIPDESFLRQLHDIEIWDSMELVFMGITLMQQSDAFFIFFLTRNNWLELKAIPSLQRKSFDNFRIPFCVANRRFLAFNRAQLKEAANELILKPVPWPLDVTIANPSSQLFEVLSKLQNEHEQIVSKRQDVSLLREISELEAECKRYDEEIETTKHGIRAIYDEFVEEQKELDFESQKQEDLRESKDLEAEEEDLNAKMAAINNELERKERKLRELTESIKCFEMANRELERNSGQARVPEIEPESSEVVVSEERAEESSAVATVSETENDKREETFRQPMRRSGYVPESLRRFVKPWMFLPTEAQEIIERSAKDWETKNAETEEPSMMEPMGIEPVGGVTDLTLHLLQEQIDDKRRRVINGTQILSEILAQDKTHE